MTRAATKALFVRRGVGLAVVLSAAGCAVAQAIGYCLTF
jgi:hypothetical protein